MADGWRGGRPARAAETYVLAFRVQSRPPELGRARGPAARGGLALHDICAAAAWAVPSQHIYREIYRSLPRVQSVLQNTAALL